MNSERKIKAVLHCILIFICMVLGQVMADPAIYDNYIPASVGFLVPILSSVIYIGVTYLLIKILLVNRGMISFEVSKFKKHRIRIFWLIVGFVLPLFVVGCFQFIKGRWIFEPVTDLRTILTAVLFRGFAGAIVEEMIFRGMIMELTKKNFNIPVAVIAPSIFFAVLHISGRGLGLGGNLQLVLAGTLAGIMFSLIALQSGSIMNSIVVHMLWNIVTNFVASGPAGKFRSLMFTYEYNSKSVLFGQNSAGMSASVFGMIAYIIVSGLAIYMFTRMRRKNNKLTIYSLTKK